MANEQEVVPEAGQSEADMFADVFGGADPAGTPAPAAEVESAPQETEPVAEAAPAAQAQPAVKPQDQQQPAAPEAVEPQGKEQGDAAGVPPWRLRELREARDAERTRAAKFEEEARTARVQSELMQRQLRELQTQIQQLTAPKQEPVDPLADPDRFVGTIEERLAAERNAFQTELRKMRLENNLALTASLHKDTFPKAYEAFTQQVEGQNDRALAARVFGSSDPGGAMVSWFRERETLREIGDDPSAYRQKALEEALKDPAFLARALEAAKAQATGQPAPTGQAAPAAQSRPNTVTRLPPSLRSTPGSAASGDGSGLQHMSEEELFNAALAR